MLNSGPVRLHSLLRSARLQYVFSRAVGLITEAGLTLSYYI